mmetsp:Transcript_26538/g.52946  ORF Transcript_26538/g.52946 Transcript_26538/m.52946 type:complete len:208 (+) Transcript_26538:542-1165(+)
MPLVKEVGAVHQHRHSALFCPVHGRPHAPRIVLSVRVAHDVDSRGTVQGVVRVKVPPESAPVEALQPDYHSHALPPPRKPRHASRLREHIEPAVQVLGVRYLNDRHQARLRKPHPGAHKCRLVRGEVHDPARVQVLEPRRDEVVAPVLHVLADVHDARVGRHRLGDAPCHLLAHHLPLPGGGGGEGRCRGRAWRQVAGGLGVRDGAA